MIISLRLSRSLTFNAIISAANTKGGSYRALLGYNGQSLHLGLGWSSVLMALRSPRTCAARWRPSDERAHERRVRRFVATAHRDVPPATSIMQNRTGPPVGVSSHGIIPGPPGPPLYRAGELGPPARLPIVRLLHLHRRCLQNALTTHLS